LKQIFKDLLIKNPSL